MSFIGSITTGNQHFGNTLFRKGSNTAIPNHFTKTYENNIYKTIFNNSPNAVVIISKEGEVINVNGRVYDLLGYHRSEVMGKSVMTLPFITKESKVTVAQKLSTPKSDRNLLPYDLNFTDKNGNQKIGRVSVSVIEDENGHIQYFLAVINEITEERRKDAILRKRKKQLKTIFAASPDILILLDDHFTYQVVNDNFCHYIGKNESDIIGKTDYDIFPEEEARIYRESDIRVLITGQRYETDRYVTGPDGNKRWLNVIKSPIKDDNGNSFGILITIREISHRKQREERIKHLADLLMQERKLFNQGPVAVLRWKASEGWPVKNSSTNVKEILGYSVQELTSGSIVFEDIIHKDDLKSVKTEIDNSINKGSNIITHSPYRIKRNDGKVIWVTGYSTVIRDEKGNIAEFLGYILDITLLKNTEEELRYHKSHLQEIVKQRTNDLEETNRKLLQSKLKAEESERLKSAFLANMSHEIRTPMNIILGFSELLKDEQDEDTKLKYIENISKSGNHLLELIDDIIDISKLQAGLVEIIKSEFVVDNEMKDIHTQFSLNKKEKVHFLLDIPDAEKPLKINTDRLLLRQVFINLISNALKFTDKGYVKFGYSVSDDYIKFFVKDTGRGISEIDKAIIFERFMQTNDNKRPISGTGLGLAICKANVKLLGGKIWFDSAPDKGSVFYFTIPAK